MQLPTPCFPVGIARNVVIHGCAARQPKGPKLCGLAVLGILFFLALLVSGCASAPLVPVQAPPAIEVLVPVPTPCEVQQVAPTALPSASGMPHDLFEAVKSVLADREVLLADREALIAANTEPCGTYRP